MVDIPPAYFTYPSPGAFYQAPHQGPTPQWSPRTTESLINAFSTVTLTPPPSPSEWVIDSGTTSHIATNLVMITLSSSSCFPSSIVVGNGATLLVIGTGYSTLSGPFCLNNVLIPRNIVKNLVYSSIHY